MSTSIRHYFKYIKNGIPIELFQILKDDAVKVLHSICQQIWKTQQWPQNWEDQFSFQSQRKAMPKNAQTFAQLHCSHRLLKSCLKFSKPGFNSTWTLNFQMFKTGFRKGRGTRDQIANICWIIKKARELQKNIYLCFIEYANVFGGSWQTVDIHKEMGIPDHLTASWEICMQVKKQQLELDMQKKTGSRSGRSTSRLCIVTLII